METSIPKEGRWILVETRFIADVMLGKLATWLRLLGCDVAYFPAISDEDLVEMASRSGRVILTRDLELIRRRNARDNHFLVTCDSYKDQLRQVVEHFSIDPLALSTPDACDATNC